MFSDILEGRNALLDFKNKSRKSQKIGIFPKRLVHGCGQKLVIFPDFYFRENRPEQYVLNQKKVFYDIVHDRNAFLDYKNKKLKKSKNWDFFKGFVHGFGQKLVIFPDFYFLGKIGQKNVFSDILEGRNAFLDLKNKKLKKSKNWDFSKTVSPWFWSKIANFFRFLF